MTVSKEADYCSQVNLGVHLCCIAYAFLCMYYVFYGIQTTDDCGVETA
jgi:hypothetical protein